MSCTDSISGRYPFGVNAGGASAAVDAALMRGTDPTRLHTISLTTGRGDKKASETMDEFGFERFCGVTLRPVDESDFPFIRDIYLSTTKRLLEALGRWDGPAAEARLARSMRQHPSRILCHGGEDAGWLQVSRTPSGFHLNQVHLVPALRNRGIGSCLIRRILARGEATRTPVTLNVILGNPAVELYRRMGFEVLSTGTELVHMRWHPDTSPKA